MREIRQLKEQVSLSAESETVLHDPGEESEQEDAQVAQARGQLAAMLAALAANVSLLRERPHEALLTQLLAIQLWTAPQVCLFPFNARMPLCPTSSPMHGTTQLCTEMDSVPVSATFLA